MTPLGYKQTIMEELHDVNVMLENLREMIKGTVYEDKGSEPLEDHDCRQESCGVCAELRPEYADREVINEE